MLSICRHPGVVEAMPVGHSLEFCFDVAVDVAIQATLGCVVCGDGVWCVGMVCGDGGEGVRLGDGV